MLGEPNAKSLLAYDIHLEEGFEPDRFVDIFDAGPVLTAQVDRSACVVRNETRIVRELAERASDADRPDAAPGQTTYLVANSRAGEFRCALVELPVVREDEAPLASSVRAVLGAVAGDAVRCVPLHRRSDDDAATAEERADLDGETAALRATQTGVRR